MHHDLSDLRSKIQIRVKPKEHTLITLLTFYAYIDKKDMTAYKPTLLCIMTYVDSRENEVRDRILHTGFSYYDNGTESRENDVRERIFHTGFSYYDKGTESRENEERERIFHTGFSYYDKKTESRENEVRKCIFHTGFSYYDKKTESRENEVRKRIFHTGLSYYDKGTKFIFSSGNYFNWPMADVLLITWL